ncbi:MFS transporter [Halodesulfurarchaeum sp.]|uniref:MFS transporter n=1 Tax=Halodesulfurarchaeum sp. TaxID=1980530 RepID=UPI002FC3C2CC
MTGGHETDSTNSSPSDETVADVFRSDRGWFLFALGFGWFLTLGSRFLVPALLPIIKTEFTLQNAGAGIIVTVMWLTYGGMQYPAGVLTDRIGERALLGASTLLASLSMVGFALAPSFGWFLVAAAIFGISTGLFGPARGTALSKRFEQFEGLAFGLVLGAGSIGAATLPLMATLITEQFGWRLAIGVVGPAFFVSGIALLVVVPKTLPGTVPAGSVVEGVRQSIVAIRTRRIVLALGGIVIMLFIYQGFTAFYPTYLQAEGGLSQTASNSLYALLFLVGGFFQLSAGRLADHFGYRWVLVGVSFVSIFPLLWLPSIASFGWFAVVTVLIAIRMALQPMMNAYILAALPEEMRGAIWGFLRTGFFILGAFGSVAVGGFADLGYFDGAIYALAVFTALGGFLFYLLPRKTPESPG